MKKIINMLLLSLIASAGMVFGEQEMSIAEKLDQLSANLTTIVKNNPVNAAEKTTYDQLITRVIKQIDDLPQNLSKIIFSSKEQLNKTKKDNLIEVKQLCGELKELVDAEADKIKQNSKWWSKARWQATGMLSSLAVVAVAGYFLFPKIQNLLNTVKDIVQTPNLLETFKTAKDVIPSVTELVSSDKTQKVADVFLSSTSTFYSSLNLVSNLVEKASSITINIFKPDSSSFFENVRRF